MPRKIRPAATRQSRAPEHQQAVLQRRASNAARWDRRPKGTRTRADQKSRAFADAA
jgi:hypothetical protein